MLENMQIELSVWNVAGCLFSLLLLVKIGQSLLTSFIKLGESNYLYSVLFVVGGVFLGESNYLYSVLFVVGGVFLGGSIGKFVDMKAPIVKYETVKVTKYGYMVYETLPIYGDCQYDSWGYTITFASLFCGIAILLVSVRPMFWTWIKWLNS
jgi:hypothetical protein